MKTTKYSLSAIVGVAIFWTAFGILSIALTKSPFVGIGCILLGVGLAIYAIAKTRHGTRHPLDHVDEGDDFTRQ